MKKHLLKLSFSAFALILFSLISAAPVEPVATMEVPAATTLFVMDGVVDDGYSAVINTTIFNPTGHDGDADFKCDFQLAYNPMYLYVLVNVTDDVEHDYQYDYETETGVGNSYEFDNIEFFFQLDTNTVTTTYSETTVQLRVCRGLDSVETSGRAARSDFGYYMEADAAGGWITELAIPWTSALIADATWEDFDGYFDAVIGFDFSAADSDNSDGDDAVGNRDVQAAWDMDDPDDEADRTEDLAWNNSSVFGYITLQYSRYFPVNDNLHEKTIAIYPNPATNEITINADGQVTIEIYNITGSLVMTANQATVDISSLNSGVYVARIGEQSVKFAVE